MPTSPSPDQNNSGGNVADGSDSAGGSGNAGDHPGPFSSPDGADSGAADDGWPSSDGEDGESGSYTNGADDGGNDGPNGGPTPDGSGPNHGRPGDGQAADLRTNPHGSGSTSATDRVSIEHAISYALNPNFKINPGSAVTDHHSHAVLVGVQPHHIDAGVLA
jgi:hypothetical protein